MASFSESLYTALLNSIPIPVFIVDGDIRILDLNASAVRTFFLEGKEIFNLRGGEAMRCLSSMNDYGGCGRGPFCKECVIRISVTDAMLGHGTTRRHTRVSLCDGDASRECELLVTVSPLKKGGEGLAIVIIEDISEFSALKNILPICSRCKKIRDDSQYWYTVEDYLNKYTGVDFSHSICPDCASILYPGFMEDNDDRK